MGHSRSRVLAVWSTLIYQTTFLLLRLLLGPNVARFTVSVMHLKVILHRWDVYLRMITILSYPNYVA